MSIPVAQPEPAKEYQNVSRRIPKLKPWDYWIEFGKQITPADVMQKRENWCINNRKAKK